MMKLSRQKWPPIAGLLLTLIGQASLGQSHSEVQACIVPAANFHAVNPYVLRSILNIEAGQKPTTISRNSNGTIDVGAGGINSRNFEELAKWGVTPNHLLDPCVSTYVSAWILSKKIRKYGNTWEGIATYHSTTPYYNRRYQILLLNDLVRHGVIEGQITQPPPLRRNPN